MRSAICHLLLAIAALCAACSRSDAPAPSAPSAAADRPPFRATALCIGDSMLPAFGVVENVTLELCSFSDLRARDTVIFWHDRTAQYAHHRLQHRDPVDGRWVTAGDNNSAQDTGRMTADEFVGRTHKFVP